MSRRLSVRCGVCAWGLCMGFFMWEEATRDSLANSDRGDEKSD